MRTFIILAALSAAMFRADGTTLLQLGLPEMAQQSTAIARVKVTGTDEVLRGADVFTVYKFETLDYLKRPANGQLRTVAVPGGTAGGIRQVVAGAPVLRVDGEYVLFLWTGRSGLTQIMGLSQGVFTVKGELVTRAAADEQMLDALGRPVHSGILTMPWTDLQSLVTRALRQDARSPLAAVGSR